MLRLRNIIDELQGKIEQSRRSSIEDTSDLIQGDDDIELDFQFNARSKNERSYQGTTYKSSREVRFSDLFRKISPALLNEAHETQIKESIGELLHELFSDEFREQLKTDVASGFEIFEDSFQTIKIQMVALGLIDRGEKKRPVQDSKTYWRLTKDGEVLMMKSRALRRSDLLDLPQQ